MAFDFLVVDDAYQGPLHLLLTLAERHEIDVERLSLVEMMDAFKKAALDEQLPLEDVGHFLYMAARLLRLRITREGPVDEEVEAQALRRDLVMLSSVQGAGMWLSARERTERFPRRGHRPPSPPPERPERLVEVLQRLAAAEKARSRPAHVDRPQEGPQLDEVLSSLYQKLRSEGHAIYDPAGTPPARRAVTLLAGLELCRRGTVCINQEAPFEPVVFRLREGT